MTKNRKTFLAVAAFVAVFGAAINKFLYLKGNIRSKNVEQSPFVL
jgi:hypothetical protein